MKVSRFKPLFYILVSATFSTQALADVVYITDLKPFTLLAPCAKSAISYAVQGLTGSKCPPGVTQLQSCACTKDQNSVAVSSSISSSVLYSCGSTASEDVSSASAIFAQYCDPSVVITPGPQPTALSEYITELPAFSYLAPCAMSAVSYGVQSLTYDLCPADASELASCACSKNQNSLAVSETLNYLIGYSCGTTHSEDMTSAQAVFEGYCGMAAGVTSFPVASQLAGSLTYYITDMPIYSSLAKCAQSAVSYAVQSQTRDLCPSDPGNLVSCACVKDQNSNEISRSMVSDVKYSCGLTASEDVSSALVVFDAYCSAGKGLATPTGITASAKTSALGGGIVGATTLPAGARLTAPTPTPTPTPTSGPGSSNFQSGDGSSNGNGTTGASTGASPGLIGGVVGGVVGALALIGAGIGIWLCKRKRNHGHDHTSLRGTAGTVTGPGGGENGAGNEEYKGPSELHNITAHPTSPPPAWSAKPVGGAAIVTEHYAPKEGYANSMHGVSPSELNGNGAQKTYGQELHGSPRMGTPRLGTPVGGQPAMGASGYRPELQGQSYRPELQGCPSPGAVAGGVGYPPELYGQGSHPELQGRKTPVYTPELQGYTQFPPDLRGQGQGQNFPPELHGTGSGHASPQPYRQELQGNYGPVDGNYGVPMANPNSPAPVPARMPVPPPQQQVPESARMQGPVWEMPVHGGQW